MNKHLLTSLAAALLIGFGGAAYAQQERTPGAPGGGGTTTMPEAQPDPGMKSGKGMDKGTGQGKMAMPTQDLVGKNILNAKGEAIGDIEAVKGNNLIVGVGGFLGLGERRVSIPWDKVEVTGTGDETKVQTNMTKAQLKSLPEYKETSREKKM